MIILGIDPGTARLGYGLVVKDGSRIRHVEHGCLETPKTMPQDERLHELHQRLDEILGRYQPAIVGVEKLFFAKNAKTAMSVSEARGIVLLAARQHGAPLSEFTPMQIKMAVTGYGSADKRQVQAMICRLLTLREIPQPDDAADALAVAYCTAASWRPQNI